MLDLILFVALFYFIQTMRFVICCTPTVLTCFLKKNSEVSKQADLSTEKFDQCVFIFGQVKFILGNTNMKNAQYYSF